MMRSFYPTLDIMALILVLGATFVMMMMKMTESRKGIVRQASCREFQVGWTTTGEAGAALLRGIVEAVGSVVNLLEAKTKHSQMSHHHPLVKTGTKMSREPYGGFGTRRE
jgi:hypothetical protein